MLYQAYKKMLADEPKSFLLDHVSYLKAEICSDVNEAVIEDFRIMLKATLDTLNERKNR